MRPKASPKTRTISAARDRDRKSTRLNSSHANISYAVFCLKKKENRVKHKEVDVAIALPQFVLWLVDESPFGDELAPSGLGQVAEHSVNGVLWSYLDHCHAA